jgi:inner membrane protein
MDLVTQTVLGAAVGEVVLGKKAGNKAILWGAIGGLLPDLDVLITPFFNDVDGLFIHRGFSHSLIFAFLVAPPLGWIIRKIYASKLNISWLQWSNLIFWAAFTHPLLDYFTTYGTGAFLPFSGYRVEFGTIGIVDLFYTLPIIIALIFILFLNRTSQLRRGTILVAVILTSSYLLGTVGNKLYINSVFKESFHNSNIDYSRFKTIPLPLTNFMWMGLAETEDGYYTALYSNFDADNPEEFLFIPRNTYLLDGLESDESLQKLISFSKGYYHVGKDDEGIFLADLRFGRMGIDEDADFIFKFYIRNNNGEVNIEEAPRGGNIDNKVFSDYISRVFGN